MADVMNDLPKPQETGLRMSRSEYRAWADAQPGGRFERVDGEIVALAPQRAVHARRKGDVYSALRQAIRTAGLACEVYSDGMTIEVDESDYEPDAVVRCGDRLDGDRVDVPDPLVIVEVLSPSTRQVDLTRKLAAYFQVASLRHHLVFWADESKVVHHYRRDGSETIETRILAAGEIRLDPPGISVSIEDIYAG